jgi:putrescine transport system substrate-binding protein
MKKLISIMIALPLLGTMSAAVHAQANVLHVYNWNDLIAEDTVANFEKTTGIKVVYDIVDSNETLEVKVLSGNSGYDVVVPSNTFLAHQAKAGAYQPLDRAKLPNWKNLDPVILEKATAFDPANTYSIPYVWGTTGIGYNPTKVKAALGVDKIESWDTIFNPDSMKKLSKCGVAFLDAPDEVYAAALLYKGMGANPHSLEDIKAAENVLKAVRPYVTYYNSSKYIADLANGDICVAIGWSGDVLQAKMRADEVNNGVQIAYVLPKEGAATWFDVMSIPADSKNVDGAHKFLNYILEAQVSADITEYIKYPTGNAAAIAVLNSETRNNSFIYPSADELKGAVALEALSPAIQRAMTRSWNTVKSGK